MLLLYSIVLALALLSGAWYLYEHRWDRRLFGHRHDTDFVVNVRAGKAASLLRESDLLPVDVRPVPDYLAAHLQGAINAPFVGSRLDVSPLDGLDRGRPILVYCDGGYRSRRSQPTLAPVAAGGGLHLDLPSPSWTDVLEDRKTAYRTVLVMQRLRENLGQ